MAAAVPPSSAVSPLATLILSLILLIASGSAAGTGSPEMRFVQCFANLTSSSSAASLVYGPKSTGYAAVLRSSVQNLRFLYSSQTSKPVLIVTAAEESHVQAAVLCARRSGLPVRGRSGGHDYEGMSYASEEGDVFVVVDIARLHNVTVDADGTAWVQAGATVGELYYAIASKNRTVAYSSGTCPTVGIGGQFSGGGIGTISRKFGTAADNIVDAKVVDADGRLLTRTTMGEDFFWALRGGGAASFGIVVAFKIKLVPVPPVVTAFNVIKTLDQGATRLVTKWQTIGPNLDINLYIRVIAQATDDGTSGNRTIQAVFNSLYLGTCADLLGVMNRSFPELGFEAKDCNEMSWLESTVFFAGYSGKPAEILLDRRPEYNSSFKAKSDFVTQPVAEKGWESIWKFLIESKDEPLNLIMEPFGGIFDEIPESAIPFPHRKGNLYIIQYFMRWFETDPQVTERHLNWMRKLYAFMTPFVSKNPRAAYVNYKDIDLGMDDGSWSYSKARVWGVKYFKDNFQRLALVKGEVDPQNIFKNEQSIPPLP